MPDPNLDPSKPQGPKIARYVSSVKGHLAVRFSTMTRSPTATSLLIGAVKKPFGGGVEWNEDEVVALTVDEYSAHKREYDRMIADGALKKRTAKDLTAWLAKREEVVAAAVKKAADAKNELEALRTKHAEALAEHYDVDAKELGEEAIRSFVATLPPEKAATPTMPTINASSSTPTNTPKKEG